MQLIINWVNFVVYWLKVFGSGFDFNSQSPFNKFFKTPEKVPPETFLPFVEYGTHYFSDEINAYAMKRSANHRSRKPILFDYEFWKEGYHLMKKTVVVVILDSSSYQSFLCGFLRSKIF